MFDLISLTFIFEIQQGFEISQKHSPPLILGKYCPECDIQGRLSIPKYFKRISTQVKTFLKPLAPDKVFWKSFFFQIPVRKTWLCCTEMKLSSRSTLYKLSEWRKCHRFVFYKRSFGGRRRGTGQVNLFLPPSLKTNNIIISFSPSGGQWRG